MYHFEICSYDCVKNRDIDHVGMAHHIIFSCSGERQNITSDITCPDIRHVLNQEHQNMPEHWKIPENRGILKTKHKNNKRMRNRKMYIYIKN